MPLYELVIISAHFKEFFHLKDLVRTSAIHVMSNGGVVRSLTSMGTRLLEQRMRAHGQYHTQGDYWTMRFDASPTLMKSLQNRLRQDPRVVRQRTLKLGEKLEDVAKPSFNKTIMETSQLRRGMSRPTAAATQP
ncbi:hypothetical protein BS47DRAFT_1319876 [Hydnum rufescens UP504]|uniref:Ribosomal protein S6 n=1 Tax=Hydnum rufescens UP504 TaxID=1448309 RepID=A0A9P6AQ91_9AGAM|nr:hypothetical protein BS47DRAFT_1319876 [Hydnum rufescens UP504]